MPGNRLASIVLADLGDPILSTFLTARRYRQGVASRKFVHAHPGNLAALPRRMQDASRPELIQLIQILDHRQVTTGA
jgi:hypothetical protein